MGLFFYYREINMFLYENITFSKGVIIMEQNTIHREILILSGREVFVIPCLAVIGAASIIGCASYGVYKIGKRVYDQVITERECWSRKES